MGFLSKINNLTGYHEAGEERETNYIERFGQPQKTLYTSAKLITVFREIDIMDEQGSLLYQSKSKVLSFKDKTNITDANGKVIARIEKKLISIRSKHIVTMEESGEIFELSSELLHIIKDVTNISGLGWKLKGNILGFSFELYDEEEQIIATTSSKLVSIRDQYSIDIYKPQYEKIIVAIMITMQHMLEDRRNQAASVDDSE